jgi:hypothetical protein
MSNIDYYKYENYYTADQYTNDYNDFDGIFIDEDNGIDNALKYGLPNGLHNILNGAIMTYNLSKPDNIPSSALSTNQNLPIPLIPNMSYLPPQNSAKDLNIHFPMNSNNTNKTVPANIPIEVYGKSNSHLQKDGFLPNLPFPHSREQFPHSRDQFPHSRDPLLNNLPIAYPSIAYPSPHFAGYVTSDRAENANIFYSTGWNELPEEFNSASSIDNDKYIKQEGNNVQWLGANLNGGKNNFVNTFAANNNYMYNNAFMLKVLLFIILIILICILCAVVANKKKYYNPIYEDYY